MKSNNHVVFTILGFHRFLELFLKDVLRSISPFLAVKFPDSESDTFKFIDGNIEAEDLRTIEGAETLKRIKQAFKQYPKDNCTFTQFLKPFEFLNDTISYEAIERLADYRNRIMHNGYTLPNLFAFEYLISQMVIPLVHEIVIAHSRLIQGFKIPYYFKSPKGFDIMEAILNLKISLGDFENTDKPQILVRKIVLLGHLKELLRASYNSNPYLRKNDSYYEYHYQNPVGRSEHFAIAEMTHEDFFSIHPCICCGVKAMVVYRHINEDLLFHIERTFKFWLKCYYCDYNLSDNLGDPYQWKLSPYPVFSRFMYLPMDKS